MFSIEKSDSNKINIGSYNPFRQKKRLMSFDDSNSHNNNKRCNVNNNDSNNDKGSDSNNNQDSNSDDDSNEDSNEDGNGDDSYSKNNDMDMTLRMKGYIDAKFKVLREELSSHIKIQVEKVVNRKFKEHSNQQLIGQFKSVIDKCTENVERSVEECLKPIAEYSAQSKESLNPSPTSFEAQYDNFENPFSVSSSIKKKEIRCPPLTEAIKEYNKELNQIGKGWNLSQLFSTKLNQDAAKLILTEIINRRSDILDLVTNRDGTALTPLQKTGFLEKKIKSLFTNLRHEFMNRNKEKSSKDVLRLINPFVVGIPLDSTPKSNFNYEKSRRRIRKYYKLDRRTKCFNQNKQMIDLNMRILYDKMDITLDKPDHYLSKEELKDVLNIQLMSDEETDEESTDTDKIFVVHKPKYRSALLTEYICLLDAQCKKNATKDIEVDQPVPNTASKWMLNFSSRIAKDKEE